MASVWCPTIAIAEERGTPDRSRFLTAVRRKSCEVRVGTPAFLQARIRRSTWTMTRVVLSEYCAATWSSLGWTSDVGSWLPKLWNWKGGICAHSDGNPKARKVGPAHDRVGWCFRWARPERGTAHGETRRRGARPGHPRHRGDLAVPAAPGGACGAGGVPTWG